MKTLLRFGLIPLFMVGCAQSATDFSSSSVDAMNSAKSASSSGDVDVASCAKPPKQQPSDVETCLHLEAALVGLNGTEVAFSGNADVQGNAYIGLQSSFKGSGNALVQGSLYSGSRSNSVRLTGQALIRGGVKSMASDVDGSLTRFSRDMALMRPTLTLNSIEKSTVIKGAGGVNVVRVRGAIKLSGNNSLVLQGSAADSFILNVDDELQMSGNSAIVLTGGVIADHVLINLVGGGCHDGIKLSGSAIVNGTILGADRAAQVTGNGRINGALIASDRIHVSGNGFVMKSAIFCSSTPAPVPSPTPAPTPAPTPMPPAPTPAPTPVPPYTDPTPAPTPMPPAPTPMPPAPTPAPTPMPPAPTPAPTPMPPAPTPMPPAPTPAPTPMPPAPTPMPTPAPTPAPTPMPPAPTPAPTPAGATISNFRVVEVFFDGFTVQWTTSEGASSQLVWVDPMTGETGATNVDATLETNHLVHVSGLNSSTDYQLKAVSKNAAGVSTQSSAISARTAD